MTQRRFDAGRLPPATDLFKSTSYVSLTGVTHLSTHLMDGGRTAELSVHDAPHPLADFRASQTPPGWHPPIMGNGTRASFVNTILRVRSRRHGMHLLTGVALSRPGRHLALQIAFLRDRRFPCRAFRLPPDRGQGSAVGVVPVVLNVQGQVVGREQFMLNVAWTNSVRRERPNLVVSCRWPSPSKKQTHGIASAPQPQRRPGEARQMRSDLCGEL